MECLVNGCPRITAAASHTAIGDMNVGLGSARTSVVSGIVVGRADLADYSGLAGDSEKKKGLPS
jgi:hypothetical protein